MPLRISAGRSGRAPSYTSDTPPTPAPCPEGGPHDR
jgi:hypothetical protein